MKKLAVIPFLFFGAQMSSADNLLDRYFNTSDNGGTLSYDTFYGYGKTSNGSDFDMCDSYSSTRIPGDKIMAITTYSGDERIKGMKIEYLHAPEETVGNTSGSGFRKILGGDEYIQGFRFYKKRDGNISRVKIFTKDMSDNSTRDIVFGGNNGWYKSVEIHLSVTTRSVVGFAGTASDSKIWSIYPCVGDRLDLIETGVEIHWDQITETNELKSFYGEELLLNGTDVDQPAGSTEVWYVEGKSETDSWSDTLGVSVTAGVSLTEGYKVGVPSTIENSGSITFSFSETFSASTTVGGTSSVNEQTTLKKAMSAIVPARTVMLARMISQFSEANIPYTSTMKNPHNDLEYEFKGVISGSDYAKASKEWIPIGQSVGFSYEIYESFAWVIDYYSLTNATVIPDPVD